MSKELTLADFTGPLEEVAAHVKELIEKHGNKAELHWNFGTSTWGQSKIVPSLFKPQFQPQTSYINLAELQDLFPVKLGTCSVTGYIPMDFVNAHLTMIAKIVKDNNLRRIYRGPRPRRSAVTTLRGDAHSLVLYRK